MDTTSDSAYTEPPFPVAPTGIFLLSVAVCWSTWDTRFFLYSRLLKPGRVINVTKMQTFIIYLNKIETIRNR